MHHQQQPSSITLTPIPPGQLQAVFWYLSGENKEDKLATIVSKVPVVALALCSKHDDKGNVGYEIAGVAHDPETGELVLTSGPWLGFSDLCSSDGFLGFESAEVKPDWDTRAYQAAFMKQLGEMPQEYFQVATTSQR